MTVNKTLWVALSLVSTGAWANPAPVTELGRNITTNQTL
ncbi:TPA: tol-pal system protein YbgF, partial [Candidatus Azambacteria bacterium]|nr:tol-pal system protein YbgF [Candidatus Azambacteria bacterium]